MPMIRRQISIDASPRTVWGSLTTVEGLQVWLADAARIDPREGGRFVITPMGGTEEIGMFHAFRPTAKIEVNWEKRGEGMWKGSFLSFLVSRAGKETIVNLQHDGPAMELGEPRTALDDWWKGRLQVLRDSLEGPG